MRCLFIPNYPPSPHYGGGALGIVYENLFSIYELGHEIHFWYFAEPGQLEYFNQYVAEDSDTWSKVKDICSSITITGLPQKTRLISRLSRKLLSGIIRRQFVGEFIHNPLLRNPSLKAVAFPEMKRLISEVKPHFIWAEHLRPAQLAVLQDEIPVIFSHSDWLYRVLAIRFGEPEDLLARAAEELLARQSTRIVSGSFVECEQLRAIGCKSVYYIPISYELAPIDLDANHLDRPRIVHFGELGGTASRVGLERFFEKVWPELQSETPELWVIGDTKHASPKLLQYLTFATCTGHVTEWSSVLRPFDIHIIPYEYNTGQRTRVPVAFNYGQVVVAVEAAISGFPEVKNGENCRLVKHLDQMGSVIQELIYDPDQRERIGKAARQTFEKNFTRMVLLSRYNEVISSLR